MTRKNLVNGMEQFDGFSIELYEGKFSGGFDLDEDLAKDIAFDDVVTFVTTARVGGVGFGETKTGDVKRVNTFQVMSSTALDPQMAAKILNTMGTSVNGVNSGQLSIDESSVNETGTVDLEAMLGTPVSDETMQKYLETA